MRVLVLRHSGFFSGLEPEVLRLCSCPVGHLRRLRHELDVDWDREEPPGLVPMGAECSEFGSLQGLYRLMCLQELVPRHAAHDLRVEPALLRL